MVNKTIYYITHWETWHWFAKYIFIGPVWLWHCLRSGSFWFFTPSNPTITFGGFTGETKNEIYRQLPPSTYPKSICIPPFIAFAEVEVLIEENGFSFPIVVKPDVGMMGFMFRRIDTIQQLRQYHAIMPAVYILQDLVTYPLEVSVFYHRFPNQQKGNITGFIKKEFMEVTGDGKRTLKELILDYPRATFRLKEMYSKHEKKLPTVIPAGERFCLSYALNLSRGGKLVSLAHQKDERLLKVFDDLSHYTKSFYYGRYDIKCMSIEDLKRGKNFSIVEYNGCGAEPHHIYGDGNTFLQGCKILLQHWNILFKISRYNHQHGVPYWKHSEGAAFAKKARKHFRKLKELDAVFEFEDETGFNFKTFQSSISGPSEPPTLASPACESVREADKKKAA